MKLLTASVLNSLFEGGKRNTEGLLPELVKRLIHNSYPTAKLRMPSFDDVWAPGFDGVVDCPEDGQFISAGKSIWEFGTNADSLEKINSDYRKRTDEPKGINKPETVFYLVISKIWAYRQSITEWEEAHRKDWKDVHIYDASKLCDWINSEPAVCAWLLEQYGDEKTLRFSSVREAWRSFSSQTDPPMHSSMFINGRENALSSFANNIRNTVCRVRANTFLEAYGFCLSALMQKSEESNTVIVVHDESAYFELTRLVAGKIFLLSFPFTGRVSTDNQTIVCFSVESSLTSGIIDLLPLWKTQYCASLQEMGLSNTDAEDCYLKTHGNLLSLIRLIPGATVTSGPKWASSPDVNLLRPIVFLRQFNATDPLNQKIISRLSGEDFSYIESKFESFLRMEDSPIKRIDSTYYIINYEEAWVTLNINAYDSMSERLHSTVESLLTECKETDYYLLRPITTIILRLIYNYVTFKQRDPDNSAVGSWVENVLGFAHEKECEQVVFDALMLLAKAAPEKVMHFLEMESSGGIVSIVFNSQNSISGRCNSVLHTLMALANEERCAIRACKLLFHLSIIAEGHQLQSSTRDSLLCTLCLWDNSNALSIEEKTKLAIKAIDDSPSFGVPLSVELIQKDSNVHVAIYGEKRREKEPINLDDLRIAYEQITTHAITTSINARHIDWLESLFDAYLQIPCNVLSSALALFEPTEYAPEKLLPFIFRLKQIVFNILGLSLSDSYAWIEPLTAWVSKMSTNSLICREGWRFYKYYESPFPELLANMKGSEREKQDPQIQADKIRAKIFISARSEHGFIAVTQLISCMEDCHGFGQFLGNYLQDDEIDLIVSILLEKKRMNLLAGMVSAIKIETAKSVFDSLQPEVKKELLPLLSRRDISKLISTPEFEQLYWGKKQLRDYDCNAYDALLKYNPCGILPIFLFNTDTQEIIPKLKKVLNAIIQSGSISNAGLLRTVIRKHDSYYSDEWAELCIRLFDLPDNSMLFDELPSCISKYFFRYPEKIIERLTEDNNDSLYFYRRYNLPNEAFSDYSSFSCWLDCLYCQTQNNPFFFAIIGAILGRTQAGADGIFPHVFIREALEKYSDKKLTTEVAIGKMNTQGFRSVQDGLKEKKQEEIYRRQAREMELDYPQTAYLLNQIADDYKFEAKSDRIYSEAYPM